MKKFLLTAFLAAAGLAVPAWAQVQANLGDLVLGFRATGGQGQNVNLEVNLGTVGQFLGQPAGTTLSVSQISAADLAAVYGANWASRTDLTWGIVGTAGRTGSGPGGSPVATLWATNAEQTVGTRSLAWTPGSRGAQFNASSNIEALLLGAPGSLNGASATANSVSSAAINATLAGSYTAQDSVQPGTSFGFFNPSINNSTRISGGSYAVSDLYEVRPDTSTATYVGSFGLSGSGTLTFSTTPTTFTGSTNLPVITTNPISQAVAFGANAAFTVAASGTGPFTYQWFKDGVALSGATASTLSLSAASSANAGAYSVRVTNAAGPVTATGFSLIVGTVPNPGRLTNLSVGTTIAAGENFSFGYVIGGAGTTGNKPMLMRAMGPSLVALQIPGYTTATVLGDPFMEYFNGGAKVSENNDWSGDTGITSTAASVGAFAFSGPTAKDAAIYLSNVAAGQNSVKVSGVGASSGLVIAELYDATPTVQYNATTPRLINVSLSKNVPAGQNLSLGFYVDGGSSMRILVRAIGPTLGLPAGQGGFGLPGVMADPKITLFDSKQAIIGTNDDWGGAAGLQVSSFPLPANSKDSAILQTLAPGQSYSLQVTAATGAGGTVILEVYEMP